MKLSSVVTFVIYISFLWLHACGATESESSLSKISSEIARNHYFKVVGWEQIPGLRDVMPKSVDLLSDIKKLQGASASSEAYNTLVSKVTNTIISNSDYECIIGNDFLIIVPKKQYMNGDLPLAMRMIDVTQSNNVTVTEFFDRIQSTSMARSKILLLPTDYFQSSAPVHTFSINSRKSVCYDVLNDVARQLKACRWDIVHVVTKSDNGNFKESGKPILTAGYVSFSAFHFL